MTHALLPTRLCLLAVPTFSSFVDLRINRALRSLMVITASELQIVVTALDVKVLVANQHFPACGREGHQRDTMVSKGRLAINSLWIAYSGWDVL